MPAVQKVWKLVKLQSWKSYKSYRKFKGGNFFETQCRWALTEVLISRGGWQSYTVIR